MSKGLMQQGRFIEKPPEYEAIQWDGTLAGSFGVHSWIKDRYSHERDFGSNFKAWPDNPDREAVIEFDDHMFPSFGNRLYPSGWVLYNTQTHTLALMSNDTFTERFLMLNEEA